MERLRAWPTWADADARVEAKWNNVIGPFTFDLSLMYLLSEKRDGAFDDYAQLPSDPHKAQKFRESLKEFGLMLDVVTELNRVAPEEAKKDEAASVADPGGDGDSNMGDGEEEAAAAAPGAAPPAAAKRAPLKDIILVPVYKDASFVIPMLSLNASDPAVVDYTGVIAFAWYLVLRDDVGVTAAEALSGALRRIVSRNQKMMGIAPQTAPKKGGFAPRVNTKDMEILRRSVEAQWGSVTPFDIKDAHSFHCERPINGVKPSEPWGHVFRCDWDLARMLHVLWPGFTYTERATQGQSPLSAVVEALTAPMDDRGPKAFGLPATAVLPLRRSDDTVTFGGVKPEYEDDTPVPTDERLSALVALSVHAVDMAIPQRSRAKSTRWPRLCMMSSDPQQRAQDARPFWFLARKPLNIMPGNTQGALNLFDLHVTDVITNAVDMCALGPEGTVLAEVDVADARLIGKPMFPKGEPDVLLLGDDDDNDGWWERTVSANGSWVLKPNLSYDTVYGPQCDEPSAGSRGLRLLSMQPLLSPDEDGEMHAVGCQMKVEPYGPVTQIVLPIAEDGNVHMPDNVTTEDDLVAVHVHASIGQKRRASDMLLMKRSGANNSLKMEWRQTQWKESSGQERWQPVSTPIYWRQSGKKLQLISLQVTQGQVVVSCREVWHTAIVTLPVRDGKISVPTPRANRDRTTRRLLVDFMETWRATTLMPTSYVTATQWLINYLDCTRQNGTPEGWDYVNPDLNPQMNFVASLYRLLDHVQDVWMYHTQGIQGSLALRHICKNRDDVKSLHQIWPGLAGTGKSELLRLLGEWIVDGVVVKATHLTLHRDSAPAPNMDAHTSGLVMAMEEMPGKFTDQDKLRPGERAHNSMSDDTVQFKDKLTNRKQRNVVLEIQNGERKQRNIQYNYDCVWIMLTNNFVNIPPAFMRRFNIVPFYSYRRMDMQEVKERQRDDAMRSYSSKISDMMKYIYIRQMMFETLIFARVVNDVPTEGWKAFASLFETTLRRNFPTVAGGLAMETLISDAHQYMRMLVIWQAVYLAFGHPRAEHREPGLVRMEDFLTAELYLAPSEQVMYLAMSMIEERLFPTHVRLLLTVLAEFFTMNLGNNQSVVGEDGGDDEDDAQNPLVEINQPEFGAKHYISAMVGRGSNAPVPTGQLRSWRSLAAMRARLAGMCDKADTSQVQIDVVDTGASVSLPRLKGMTEPEIEKKLEYVELFTMPAVAADAFRRAAVSRIHAMQNHREEGHMEHEHVLHAMMEMMEKSVVTRGSKAVLPMLAIEEIGSATTGTTRAYRLVILKSALDDIAEGNMSISRVFALMATRTTPPGVYLLAAPYHIKCAVGEGHLPQLPAAMTVPHHVASCPATANPARLRSIMKAIDSEAAAAAEEALEAKDTAAFLAATMRQRCAWADPACVEELGCNCFRRQVMKRSTGYKVPAVERELVDASFHKGLLPLTEEPRAADADAPTVYMSFSEVGWLAHVRRVMGRPWEELNETERAQVAPAHPEAREPWMSTQDVEYNKKYPHGIAHSFVEMVAERESGRRQAVSGAVENATALLNTVDPLRELVLRDGGRVLTDMRT